jgi:hypothetical protein
MSSEESLLHPRRRFPWPGLVAPAIFFFLTLLLFNDALFDATKVISGRGSDLEQQFLPWRKFGFDQLRHWNLALWNPHIYGGAPYFAGFQSALLYPPNWLHLFMPVGLAIDWINALHVFLAGMFTYAWCRHRELSRGGSILAGVMFMFSGPYFPHVYAGHLPHIAIMVWAPLLFLAIDLVMEGNFGRGTLLGIVTMTMFLLAGHPQYVYYTGMAAAVYALINLVRAKKIPLALAGCALIVGGGVAIAAVQVLSGIDAASESVRSSGTEYSFSASFSFPPQNVLTALAPDVFGPMSPPANSQPPDAYFGVCYAWEMSLFVSVTGLILAIYGSFASSWRYRRGAIIMAAVCFILALGAHTPLHHFLYNWLPGFGSFRGSTKFNYLVALFVSLLAACGFDQLLRAGRAPIGLLIAAVVSLAIVFSMALTIESTASDGLNGIWGQFLRRMLEAGVESNEVFTNTVWMGIPTLVGQAGLDAAHSLYLSAGIITLIVMILAATWYKRQIAYALIVLAMIEMVWFAASTRATSPSDIEIPQNWATTIKNMPPDARVMEEIAIARNNAGMWFGYDDVWGYDPGVLKRYAELVTLSQGGNPEKATQYVQFHKMDANVFPLLRAAAAFLNNNNQPVVAIPSGMNVAQLIPTAIVKTGRDDVLATIESKAFSPRQQVVLETPPSIKPADSLDPGSVNILKQSTDSIELTVDAHANSILLITNSFSKGWHVSPIGPTPQENYQVVPADWAFQAIPLTAGQHHLLVEYRPTAFVLGKWISILSVLGYITAIIWYFHKHGFAAGHRADG